MKKLIILAVLLTSCQLRKKEVEKHKCVITKVKMEERYQFAPGMGRVYIYTTDCGATATSQNCSYSAGDTVDVEIVTFK